MFTTVFSCLQAQDQVIIRLGPALGYRMSSFDVSAEVAPEVITSSHVSGLLPALSASAGVFIRVHHSWLVRFDTEAQWMAGTLPSRFTFPIAIDGELASGTIRRDHEVTSSLLQLGVGCSFQPTPLTIITASAGLALPQQMDVSVSDVIESPSGATFVSTGTPTRNLGSGTIIGSPLQTHLTILVEAMRRFMIGEAWAIAPYLRGRVAATSALEGASWHPWEIGIGVDVQWTAAMQNVAPEMRQDVFIRREQRDTVTMIDSYAQGRTDTTWTTTEVESIDTIQGEVDTIVIDAHTTVTRHIPSPPPFLSAILDVQVLGLETDSTARLQIGLDRISDTTATSVITITEDGILVWSDTTDLSAYRRDVALSTIISDIDRRDQVNFVIASTTIDAVGQEHQSIPQHITLKRREGGPALFRHDR